MVGVPAVPAEELAEWDRVECGVDQVAHFYLEDVLLAGLDCPISGVNNTRERIAVCSHAIHP